MNKKDPVINGFSQSVIKALIENLHNGAIECYNKTSEVLLSPEKDAMITFTKKYSVSIRMLAKWMLVDAPKFRNAKAFGDFLQDAKDILDDLAPPTK